MLKFCIRQFELSYYIADAIIHRNDKFMLYHFHVEFMLSILDCQIANKVEHSYNASLKYI